jgi:hypothetical protein
MNIIIEKPQLVKVVKLYLTKNYGNLTPKTSSKYPDSVFYVNSDNFIPMRYHPKNKDIWIDYNSIWSKLERYFYLNYDDIQLIIKDWLEEHYNLKGVRPYVKYIGKFPMLEEHYKLRRVTP